MLDRPRVDQPHYGRHLGDADYWRPYVDAVVQRRDLPVAPIESPFVGTFPTFLVGDMVVKLFGETFDGADCHAAELAMHELVADHPDIPAPALIASGQLFDDGGHRWPYLVTQRLAGTAIREAHLTDATAVDVAGALGAVCARVHALTPPTAVADRELVDTLRASAPERLRRFGLPDHLVDGVPDFLADSPAPRTLVHADITEDHVFVNRDGLVGIIDWGDAIVADPYYELVAVHFGALAGRRPLLDAFLAGYGWSRDEDFARRALQGVLEFQFDAIGGIGRLVDLTTVASLDELAERVFA